MIIKINDRIKTPDGWGKVELIEQYTRLQGLLRYCIRLEDTKELKCYWAKELKHNLTPGMSR